MHATNGRRGQKTIKVYSCAYHRDRGNTVCSNSLRRPVELMDAAVLYWIEQHVLTEDSMLQVLDELRRRVGERTEHTPAEVAGLEKQAEEFHAQIGRLTEALATGSQSSAVIIAAIKCKRPWRCQRRSGSDLNTSPAGFEPSAGRAVDGRIPAFPARAGSSAPEADPQTTPVSVEVPSSVTRVTTLRRAERILRELGHVEEADAVASLLR